MILNLRIFFAILLAILFVSSCTTSTGFVNYSDYNVLIGADSQQTIGVIRSTKRSFFWTPCSDLAAEAIADLYAQAKALGGSYITNVTYEGDNNARVVLPTCSTAWGWTVLYLLPEFGPWTMRVSAEAYVTRGNLPIANKTIQNLSQGNNQIKNSERIDAQISDQCARIVAGDDVKVVCGDTKDRVLQKWGNPSQISPSQNLWFYNQCSLLFTNGRLSNYGGNCNLTKISNDSFVGERVVY